MEKRCLIHENLEPKFRVFPIDDHKWKVTDHLLGDVEVTHLNGFYQCSCNKEEEPPWQECEHVLTVQQYELQQLEEDMASQGMKAFADSILWQIGQLESEIQRNNQSAEHQIKRIELWRKSENRILEKRIDAKAILLNNYMRYSGKRTENLVNGTVRLRKQQPKITITEVFDLEQDSFVRVVPEQRKPDLRAIRNHLNQTGEILAGTEMEYQPDKLSWQVKPLNQNIKGEEYESDESNFRKAG